MRYFGLSIAAYVALFSSPALADETWAVTPSGSAEVEFGLRSADAVQRISSRCIDAGWRVTNSSTNQVVCEAPLNTGQSVLGQLLLGNSYSTPPRRFFRFNVAEINRVSRVQANGWMELQMAFGQMQRTDFSGPEFNNGMTLFLMSAGGQLPTGTTFPNHVSLGIEYAVAPYDGKQALRVTEVRPGGSAATAGVQVGDLIFRIAGERFEQNDDLLDALAEAAEDETYRVDVDRDGERLRLEFARRYPEAITASVTPYEETAVTVPSSPEPSFSIAEELARFVELRDSGVITTEEFETQKARLLGTDQTPQP